MMRFLRLTFLLVLIPVLVQAQSTSISLDEAVELFKQNSLQQELARYDRLRKQGKAIRYRSYPNPEFSVNREQLNAGPVDYRETTYQISQPIELLGQPFLRSRSASKSQKAAKLQYEYDRQQLIGEVKTLYAESWQLSHKLRIYNRAMDLVRNARESARERRAEGTYSGLQLQRFNIELNRYRKQRDQVRLNLQQTNNRLVTYLFRGRESEMHLLTSDSLKVTPLHLQKETLIQYALAHRADLQALSQSVDASRLQYKVEKRNQLPDLNLNLGYKDQSDGAEGFVLGGSIDIPLFNQNQGDVTISRAQTRTEQTRLTLKQQTIRNQVEVAYKRVEVIAERWKAMQQDSRGTSLLNAARAAYQQGRYSLVELLDATQAFVDGQTMIYETIADYNQALFKLDVLTAGRISNTQHN